MEHKHKGHAKAYIKVWLTLLVLTIITVTVSYHDYGDWNIFVAMLVATIKATLVCLIFMHLLYDKWLVRVVFASSFFFLALFVGLTASDELFRQQDVPVKVSAAPVQGATPSQAEFDKLHAGSPELVAKGKEIYSVQCAVCHGPNGKGDGPAGSALNPHPRNFTENTGWHYGQQPTRIFKTLTEGSPGTAMASFANLSVEERWALVAYVRSFATNPPPDTPETLALVKVDAGADADEGAKKPAQTIPIAFAIERMALPETPSVPDATAVTSDSVYQIHCASCHGASGKGGINVARISVNPPVYLTTKSFTGSQASWVNNRAEFIDLVSRGIPGSAMPGQAEFTDTEWDALYNQVRAFSNK